MASFGSLMGGQNLGGMDALKAAMDRRGGVGGGSMQQSASSAGGQPPMPMAPQGGGGMPPGGQPLPMGMGGQHQSPGMGGGLPPETSESILLIKALGARLASDSKIRESQSLPPKPPTMGF